MDPIANFLTVIRNGYLARLKTVSVSHSKILEKLADILFEEGFIDKPEVSGATPSTKKITVGLKYPNREPQVTGIKLISKPGVRIYSRADKFPRVRFGFGVTIISTSKGLMTNREAKKQNLGGEIICQVW